MPSTSQDTVGALRSDVRGRLRRMRLVLVIPVAIVVFLGSFAIARSGGKEAAPAPRAAPVVVRHEGERIHDPIVLGPRPKALSLPSARTATQAAPAAAPTAP